MTGSTFKTQGFALCTPGGTILGYSYRETAAKAISALWDQSQPVQRILWEERRTEGWSVVPVVAHMERLAPLTIRVVAREGRLAS
ncbi:hypothetical protein SAMN02983003_3143 [Devosia enhydra]|uniref:Uncharacterized protein n=1 Tax=Devosia enhydra TaxID=665118 RepID=A0A1K2I178_9HYPH|nr:hypothetical protein [Devosia enhydra]SFZ85971.1 hypothetical protein SAMN02983003_3143 [Devosia enhydra]